MVSPALDVEPDKMLTSGVCECCGRVSRQLTGLVHEGEATLAGYVVQWTVGHFPTLPANMDLVLGRWGEGASAEQRFAVCLEIRTRDDRPDLLVIDAGERAIARNVLVGAALAREQVIGTPLATQVFAVTDAIFSQDTRLRVLFEEA